MKINFDIFNNATIKKEYLKDGIKYLELTYYDEEPNKLYVFNMSYKRYLLQKYLGYLIPKEHHVIPLDGNEENFDIYNLGIRDENNESPIYKGWKIKKIFYTNNVKQLNLINDKKEKKQKVYKKYLIECFIGRELIDGESVEFINKNLSEDKKISLSNLKIRRYKFYYSFYPNYYVTFCNSYDRVLTWSYKKNPKLKKQKPIRTTTLHVFNIEKSIGRELHHNERAVFLNNNLSDYTKENIIIKKIYLDSKLYLKHTITGPYFDDRKREFVLITNIETNKVIKLSYPRFILQEHLGRFLTEDETVHHKDGNFYNNDLNNLTLRSWEDHTFLDIRRLKPVELECQICKNKFILEGRSLVSAYHRHKDENKIGPFCSINCAIKARYKKHLYKNILPKKQYYNLSGTIN